MGLAGRARAPCAHFGVPTTLPPYALSVPTFRFRALASLVGRAPIGGAREVALACFVVARLAVECREAAEDPDVRTTRASAAPTWLGTLSLPAAVRAPVLRCADASGHEDAAPVARELATLATAASTWLDPLSRTELEALTNALRA